MFHPPTDTPSRHARPSGRPGVVALPVAAALAAVLVLFVTLTARGGTADDARRAAPPVPSATRDPYGNPYGTPSPDDGRDTPGGHGTDGGRGALDQTAAPRPGSTSAGPSARRSAAPGESPSPRTPRTRPGPGDTPQAPASKAAPTAPAKTSGARRTAASATRPARPKGQARPAPYDVLRVGDCFDIDRAAPGTVVRRACDTPHDAQAVARMPLRGRYADDAAVREAAAGLCRAPLRAEAAEQPVGTRWATFVQYPYRTSYLLGADRIVCSLAVPSGSGRKITAPLR
ncbi:hypothetical protein [Streptomyces laurentii]|uniref:hypothetical protein n=1 Tax=Streptomyces laurentii TaxID=39478 RepID=UPI00367748B3